MLEANQAHPITLERDPKPTIELIELIERVVACLFGRAPSVVGVASIAATIRIGPHEEIILHILRDDEAGAHQPVAESRRRPEGKGVAKGWRCRDGKAAAPRRPSAPGRGRDLRRTVPDEYRLSLGGDAGDAG